MELNSRQIKQTALQCGFHQCGMAPAGAMPHFLERLQQWSRRGCQAEMHFMENLQEMRSDPTLLLPGARTVISLLVGYKPTRTMQGNARIASYAYGTDYHEELKRKCYLLISKLKESHPEFEGKVCVDTVPISDKLWAQQAGLGWIGKNTLLINPQLGSFCNIAEIVTTASVDQYDTPLENRCGDCRLCLDACPNHALDAENQWLDANRCTSYHTIENRQPQLPSALNRNGYAFGCDCCQLVCPYNRTTQPQVEITEERLEQLQSLPNVDEATFRRLTRHSAMNRIKYPQWQRNINS